MCHMLSRHFNQIVAWCNNLNFHFKDYTLHLFNAATNLNMTVRWSNTERLKVIKSVGKMLKMGLNIANHCMYYVSQWNAARSDTASHENWPILPSNKISLVSLQHIRAKLSSLWQVNLAIESIWIISWFCWE